MFSAMVAVYYNVVIAYAIYYLMVSIISFDGDVPWSTCGNEWNTEFCITEGTLITTDMNDTQKLNITLGIQEDMYKNKHIISLILYFICNII